MAGCAAVRRFVACALLMLCAGLAQAAEDPALAILDACRARLDARVDVGLERIGRRCPELLPALQKAPWRNLLPRDMQEGGAGDRRDDISADSLRELAQLVRESGAAKAARPAPDVGRLAPVLAGLGEKGQQGATRWERFKRWIKEKMQRERKEGEESWLRELGQEFETSEGVARAITYTGYALVVLLVLFVIWSELRAAGLLGGRRAAGARAAAGEWRRRLQLADVLQAPLSERPGLMLKLLGEALTRAQRLPAADGLTASALVRQARLEDLERSELERVARTAEAVRYAPASPEDEKLEGAVTAARSLLEKLTRVKPGFWRVER
jgi:hypothetical protein